MNLQQWLRPLAYLGRNPITLTGAVLTTSAGVTLVFYLVLDMLLSRPLHPYAGIALFGVLPAVFVLGLLLMPLGGLLRRRALLRAGQLPSAYPVVDLGLPVLRNSLLLVGVGTMLNVGILGAATYKGVEYMDSSSFCGETCHTVMQPEYAAYLGSPHSRVHCVQCHIGPGASWFVKSKLDGLRQVVSTALNTYSRPIPSPVHTLRPARETCEQCHWPRKFHGDKLQLKTSYSEDEASTRSVTVLLLRIGGHAGTAATGIHGRHLDDQERIRYVAVDERRQQIARVVYLDDEGRTVEYLSDIVKIAPEELLRREERSMDCVDCHNRPTHAFDLPHRAIDRALEEGKIPRDLPWIKKKAVELIKASYPDREVAARAIGEGLLDFYRKEHPEVFEKRRADIERAAEAARAAYLRNVFPAMNVGWGTHPNNIGHEDFPGCFRCHDGSFKSKDGREISSDCTACHAIVDDPKAVADLGIH